MLQHRSFHLIVSTFLLPLMATAQVICTLGAGKSYNAYADERPTGDAMQLAAKVNAALAPICLPKCPAIALFRNATAPNAMLIAADGQAKVVYAPAFFTDLYETSGDGAIIAIIAHEYGHALDETLSVPWMKQSWPPELRADAWAGCALSKSELSMSGLEAALAAISKYPSPAHPSWAQRLPAWRLGYVQCGGDGAKFDRGASGHKRG